MSAMPDVPSVTVDNLQAGRGPTLSDDDWRVVATALREAGGPRPSARNAVARVLNHLLSRHSRPLDQKRSALQAFIRSTRRHRTIDEIIVLELYAQGFSADQINAIALMVL
jgi:hypothetical protein